MGDQAAWFSKYNSDERRWSRIFKAESEYESRSKAKVSSSAKEARLAAAPSTITTETAYGLCDASWSWVLGYLKICPRQFPFKSLAGPTETLYLSPEDMVRVHESGVRKAAAATPSKTNMLTLYDIGKTTTTATLLETITEHLDLTSTVTVFDDTVTETEYVKAKPITSTTTLIVWVIRKKPVKKTTTTTEYDMTTSTKTLDTTVVEVEYGTIITKPRTATRTIHLPETKFVTAMAETTTTIYDTKTVSLSIDETFYTTNTATLTDYAATITSDSTYTHYLPRHTSGVILDAGTPGTYSYVLVVPQSLMWLVDLLDPIWQWLKSTYLSWMLDTDFSALLNLLMVLTVVLAIVALLWRCCCSCCRPKRQRAQGGDDGDNDAGHHVNETGQTENYKQPNHGSIPGEDGSLWEDSDSPLETTGESSKGKETAKTEKTSPNQTSRHDVAMSDSETEAPKPTEYKMRARSLFEDEKGYPGEIFDAPAPDQKTSHTRVKRRRTRQWLSAEVIGLLRSNMKNSAKARKILELLEKEASKQRTEGLTESEAREEQAHTVWVWINMLETEDKHGGGAIARLIKKLIPEFNAEDYYSGSDYYEDEEPALEPGDVVAESDHTTNPVGDSIAPVEQSKISLPSPTKTETIIDNVAEQIDKLIEQQPQDASLTTDPVSLPAPLHELSDSTSSPKDYKEIQTLEDDESEDQTVKANETVEEDQTATREQAAKDDTDVPAVDTASDKDDRLLEDNDEKPVNVSDTKAAFPPPEIEADVVDAKQSTQQTEQQALAARARTPTKEELESLEKDFMDAFEQQDAENAAEAAKAEKNSGAAAVQDNPEDSKLPSEPTDQKVTDVSSQPKISQADTNAPGDVATQQPSSTEVKASDSTAIETHDTNIRTTGLKVIPPRRGQYLPDEDEEPRETPPPTVKFTPIPGRKILQVKRKRPDGSWFFYGEGPKEDTKQDQSTAPAPASKNGQEGSTGIRAESDSKISEEE
ncbi:hypothetical protein LTR05_001386 [Lithohypha guttulata]|uniref:Uncharacterized protein n=1 Tax=Lithohypha guttulata TaxID=1690604 RepID=A0AAN7T951_9EURO|nr:hypothetical protein LTR05_001386 [Lithohypha guttulata]